MNLKGVAAKFFPGEDPRSTQFPVLFPRHQPRVPLRFPSSPLPYNRSSIPELDVLGAGGRGILKMSNGHLHERIDLCMAPNMNCSS